MPLNKADHAANPAAGSFGLAATLTDNWPRVALSLTAVVNTSNSNRSCTGPALTASLVLKFPVQFTQVFVPIYASVIVSVRILMP